MTYVGISSKNVLRNQKLLNAMFTPLRILYANVDDLVAAADFKVSKAAHVSGGDRGLIKVDFTSKHEPVENFQVSGGWMILDSNRSWALREYRVDANQGAVTVHGVVDYEGEIKGYPLARHRQVELIDPATKTVNMTYDYDYSNVGPGDLEPRDCRLTAFGFPEPGIAKSRWLMVKLLAINGVLVGGLVLLSVYYRKRSSSRVQASPNSTPR
ncbi:MAG: hypothetical protein P4L84_03305 [Isosphaeraceae bacterium]|nr:hypothetical protein [Isosphaeraceae bacterium]